MSEAKQEEQKTTLAAVKSMTEERDKEIVAKLEEFVALAKEGHVSDIAVICKVRGEPITEFNWESSNPLELIGSLDMAKQEIILELLDAAEGDDDEEDDD